LVVFDPPQIVFKKSSRAALYDNNSFCVRVFFLSFSVPPGKTGRRNGFRETALSLATSRSIIGRLPQRTLGNLSHPASVFGVISKKLDVIGIATWQPRA
jgi:hypothetical protein